MPRLRSVFTLGVAVVVLSGCGTVQKKLLARKQAAEKAADAGQKKDMFIGVIESVNPEQKFVLIRLDRRLIVPAGTTLDVRSAEGQKSTLVVTPEHKLSFLSADITSGTPGVGDIVILPQQAAAVVTPAVPPGTQSASLEPPPETVPVPDAPPGGSAPLPLPVR